MRIAPKWSFSKKVLAVAIVGAHLPLIALLPYVILNPQLSRVAVVGLAFLATAVATFLMVVGVRALLSPIMMTVRFLDRYEKDGVISELPGTFDDEIGRLMAGTRRVVARADQGLRELAAAASTDSLTGVFNRREGQRRLEEEVRHSRQLREPLTVLVLDLDAFKTINDDYGHGVGDRCLTHLATHAKSLVAGGGWVARWGGDEFLIALPKSDAARAAEIANALRERLMGQTIQPLKRPFSVTIGQATLQSGQDADALFRIADAALIDAKRAGRSTDATKQIGAL